MNLDKKQMDAFKEAATPLVAWLNENANPHAQVIVDSGRAELVEGVCSVKIEEFIQD